MTAGKLGRKIDGLPKITGHAQYVADMKRPRMLHGKFLRSPHPHANIVSIDLSKALALEGVQLALTGDDFDQSFGVIPVAQDEWVLAKKKVRYVGEPVVAIFATDPLIAIEACELVEVEYEELEGIFTIEDALNKEKPLIHPERRKASNVLRRVHQKYGDIEAGMAEADLIIEDTYEYPGSTHVPLETHACLAEIEADGKVLLYTSTQIPHYVHRAIAKMFELDPARVRVIKPEVGAGYGGKSDVFSHEYVSVAAAMKTGRPVRFVLDREEVFYTHRGRHPVRMHLKLGISNDGRITGIDFEALAPGGAYASYGVVTSYYLGVFMTLPYKLDNYRFTSQRLYTNAPPCGPKRGHGAIQPRFALEMAIDKAARALDMDPADFRMMNIIESGTETANGLRITSVGMKECLEKVLEVSDYKEKLGKLPAGKGIGLALSAYMSGALHPIYQNQMPQSGVQLRLDRSGEITILSGTADIGQGSNHLLAACVAERLGVSTDRCRVIEADTSLTPVDLGSYSSRVTFFAGNAALMAADKILLMIREALAEKWDVAMDSIELADERVFVPGDEDKNMDFMRALWVTEEKFGTLGATGWYKPPKIGNRFKRQSVGPSPAYSFTAQVAELTVDEETGIVSIDKIWAVHDCGYAISPTICEGQIEGCVYMGVGEALLEEDTFIYRPKGVYRTPSLLEYRIPTSVDTPPIEVHLVESHDPEGPLGAKEAGEGPQLSTVPAVANALYDATGVWFNSAPFYPDRVLKGIERAKRQAERRLVAR